MACSSHTKLSVDLTPHIPQISRLNDLVNGKGTLSPIRLFGDIEILGRWKASQKDQPQPSSEPHFSTHQLTKFTVDEFFAYFEVSGSVRTICELSVREFAQQPIDYDVLVKKVAEITRRRYHTKENASRVLLSDMMLVDGQPDSSVDEFVDVSAINRRQSTRLLEQSKQRQQEKRRKLEQRKAKQRNQGGGIVSVGGVASAATMASTTAATAKNRQDKSSSSHPTNGIVHQVLEQNEEEEEGNMSSSSSSNATISCKQFWSLIDQLYYRSLPSVADCLPKPPEIQTTGKIPTSRGFTQSLMEFAAEGEGEENDKQELLVLVDGGRERVQQGAIPRRDVRYDND